MKGSTFELHPRATCSTIMRKYHYATSFVWRDVLQLYMSFLKVIQRKHWLHKLALGTKFFIKFIEGMPRIHRFNGVKQPENLHHSFYMSLFLNLLLSITKVFSLGPTKSKFFSRAEAIAAPVLSHISFTLSLQVGQDLPEIFCFEKCHVHETDVPRILHKQNEFYILMFSNANFTWFTSP